ncbi:MAG: hypothetical protein IPK28_09225 [Devosia sp.]|nr:hypothetical protein [Devosia sp.]
MRAITGWLSTPDHRSRAGWWRAVQREAPGRRRRPSTGLRAQKFDLWTRASGTAFTVAITSIPAATWESAVVSPRSNNIDRVAIERKQLAAATSTT